MVENIYKGLRRHYPGKLYHSKKRSILNSSTISTDFLLRQVWEAEHNLSFCGVYWGIDMQVSDVMMPTLSLFFIFFFFSVFHVLSLGFLKINCLIYPSFLGIYDSYLPFFSLPSLLPDLSNSQLLFYLLY